MTDEQGQSPDFPHDPTLDPAEQAWIAGLLGGLTDLRPEDAPTGAGAGPSTDEPMPAWVWARLEAALTAEQASGTASDLGLVATAGSTAPRRGRATRWAGGLVAASVAVLAIGVGVTAFRGGATSSTVVAGEVVSTSSTALKAAAAPNGDAALTQPPQLTFAGMVPPTLRLMDSRTDYTDTGLRSQVTSVLQRIGMTPQTTTSADIANPPTTVSLEHVAPTGFVTSAQSLRDCITRLMKSDATTALLVDMSTYDGKDAGVVVAPDYSASATPDMSQWDVYVVDPTCTHVEKVLLQVMR
jgi:hypothetical protein